jgi:hypothetical protein
MEKIHTAGLHQSRRQKRSNHLDRHTGVYHGEGQEQAATSIERQEEGSTCTSEGSTNAAAEGSLFNQGIRQSHVA